jgi:Niemann-Pick C1 protein
VDDGDDDWRTLIHEPGFCATYGICGHRADGDPLSCATNIEAQPLNGTALQKLHTVCPQLAEDVGGDRFCCTEEQLDQLQAQVGLGRARVTRGNMLVGRRRQGARGQHPAGCSPALLCQPWPDPHAPPSSSAQIQVASIFLVGCPACNHNFKHFFCLLTCSPDQAAYANVTAVQPAPDTGATAIEEADFYVAASFGERFYNSCKDVVYPVANQRAMTFVGG